MQRGTEQPMSREQRIHEQEQRLDQLGARVTQLQDELERADTKLRETYRTELKALVKRRGEAQAQLAQLRLQEAESWQQQTLLTGVAQVLDEIGQRLDRLFTGVRGHKR